jgi:serine/threonine-protein kinase
LDAVVMKCMAKNPANRYQTAEELSADLERVKQGQDVEATPLMAAGVGGDATQVIARPAPTQVMPPPDEDGSSRKVWLGVLIGLLIFALLAAGGYLIGQAISNKDAPAVVTMPNLVGKSLDEATQMLQDDNLALGNVTKQKTDAQPKNTVIDQSVVKGTQIPPQSAVDLVIAVPIPKVAVPDVSSGCLTLDAAQSTLQDHDLQVGTTLQGTSDTCQQGEVIGQDPPAGTEVKPNTLVTLTVASGPSTITVADYTCQTFSAAQNKISHAGLDPAFGGTKPVLPQCPGTNRVVDQDPAPGTQLRPGDTVTLWTGSATATPTTSPTP